MHNPVTANTYGRLHTHGVSLELFHCSHDVVTNWNDPVLRSTFWRCYLATSRGATLRSPSQEWALLPHTVCIIPPDSPVSGRAAGPFSLYYAHFNASIHLSDSTPLFMSSSREVEAKLKHALEIIDKHLFRSSMLELTANAMAAIPADLLRAPIADTRIGKAYWVMKEHINRRLSNAELAASLNISETSLLRMFRASIGASPQKEHLRLRLEHAADMLRETEETIENVAEACGFWDRNHFTRVFTREWRVPPAHYRRSATAV